MKILTVYSIKGGVGKTSSAVNLAYESARSGFKTLLWDLDPQAASTFYFRVERRLKAVDKMMIKKKFYAGNIKASDFENLDILPADFSIRNMDVFISANKKAPEKVKKTIHAALDEYDLVILDCPPGMTLMSEVFLNLTDFILTPIIPTTLSVRTHNLLKQYLSEKGLDSDKIHSFFSMVDKRKNMHQQTMSDFKKTNHNILKTHIMYSAVIEKMGMKREPVACFEPSHAAALSFRVLWREVRSSIKL